MAELMEDYKKMKVPELKVLLKEKGLPVSGTKSDLLKRLAVALGTADNQDVAIDESIDNMDDILNDEPLNVTAKTQETKPELTTQAKSTPAATLKATVKPVQKTDPIEANGNTENKESTVTTEAAKPSEISKLSAEERLKLRASKFGVVSIEAKKQLRAQRFGSDTNSTALSKLDSKLPVNDFNSAAVTSLQVIFVNKMFNPQSKRPKKAEPPEQDLKRLRLALVCTNARPEQREERLQQQRLRHVIKAGPVQTSSDKFFNTSQDILLSMNSRKFLQLSKTIDSSQKCYLVDDLEKLKKRADRFGAVVSTSLSKVDEEEKKRKRAERFGATNTTATTRTPITFNSSDPDIEAKKKKRAERFGLAT